VGVFGVGFSFGFWFINVFFYYGNCELFGFDCLFFFYFFPLFGEEGGKKEKEGKQLIKKK
jgi:hypothetical protein